MGGSNLDRFVICNLCWTYSNEHNVAHDMVIGNLSFKVLLFIFHSNFGWSKFYFEPKNVSSVCFYSETTQVSESSLPDVLTLFNS